MNRDKTKDFLYLMKLEQGEWRKLYEKMNAEKDRYKARLSEMPETVAGLKKDQVEDLLLTVASIKGALIDIHEDALRAFRCITIDSGKYEAKIRTAQADSYLRDCGFLKISEELRKTFCKTSPELAEFNKLKADFESITAWLLNKIRQTEFLETNFRKIYEIRERGSF